MNRIQFNGNPHKPDLAEMSLGDQIKLESLISLAKLAIGDLKVPPKKVRKTFDRISALHRFVLANPPVTPEGRHLKIDNSVQSEEPEQEPEPSSPDAVEPPEPNYQVVAHDALAYWGNYIFREAVRRNKV